MRWLHDNYYKYDYPTLCIITIEEHSYMYILYRYNCVIVMMVGTHTDCHGMFLHHLTPQSLVEVVAQVAKTGAVDRAHYILVDSIAVRTI